MSAKAQSPTPLTVAQFDSVVEFADVDGASMVLLEDSWVETEIVDELTEVYADFGMERIGMELVEETNLSAFDEVSDEADMVVAFE